ncbi:hypothetical protein UNPF46_03590 [Bradyrhizobium sp. UNPF46]|uniref:hypothetical protein n=1 Tax=Bradyrhizobium sp. UNPF46 TaxID=1141168 RepID=UPI00116939D7|nr:hypothetical protein [Bradyrhizobium sp. UNPF46]TQF43024.1 hypothetical protein UNPF46_03590 [Bradyrhizobium sp. UNPF46]
MELRTFIRTDIAASALAHLTLVALIIVISEVHPFRTQQPETVTVDIVTPEQVKQEVAKAEEKAQEEAKEKPPEPELKLPKLDFTDKAPEASKSAAKQQAPSPQPSPEPQRPAQQQPQPPPKPREANAQPQQPPPQQPPPQQPPPQPQPQAMPQPPQPQAQQPPPQSAPPPAYQAPQPDVTVKYGVMLGLPPELPAPLPKDAPKDDGGDAKDSIAAKLPAEIVAELRRHLRGCAKLPAGLSPTDNVHIKLRTVFATDGTLAREPILIEAPPSAKGVALVKSAMSAIQGCQPYKMLPPNLYEEWKVMDLPFSPRDFGG